MDWATYEPRYYCISLKILNKEEISLCMKLYDIINPLTVNVPLT